MDIRFRFLRYRFATYVVSLLLVLGSVALLALRGLNLGLDFTGGSVVEVRFEKSPSIGELRRSLKEEGLESFLVQETKDGTFIVKIRKGEDVSAVRKALRGYQRGA